MGKIVDLERQLIWWKVNFLLKYRLVQETNTILRIIIEKECVVINIKESKRNRLKFRNKQKLHFERQKESVNDVLINTWSIYSHCFLILS